MPKVRSASGRSSAAPWLPAASWTALAVGLAVVLRLPFVSLLPAPDEGGLLVVARDWHAGGPQLYGSLFLDRPPLLVLFWRLASVLGGIEAARYLAIGAVAILVASAGWAGFLLGGPRGARWCAFTAAAFACTPVLGSQEVDGELLAVPLVMLSCALVLAATRQGTAPRWRIAGSFASGVAGAGALLVKQDFADGLVFGAVLVLALGLAGSISRSTAWRLLLAGMAGAALPIGATMVWAATTGPGLGTLWQTLYGFRVAAADVIARHRLSADERRLGHLVDDSFVSGLVPLLVVSGWAVRRRLVARDPLTLAWLAMLAVELVGVALGGSYWPHYLIGLVPSAALAAARLPRLGRRAAGWVRPFVVFAVGSAVIAALGGAVFASALSRPDEQHLVAWLRKADRPGDTGVVTYGEPNVLEASGLQPGRYPYIWSLELRTEDPHLTRLTRLVSGRSAPTWIVEWMPWNVWGIDQGGAFKAAVTEHYRRAGTICGTPVFLRDGVSRALPPPPVRCATVHPRFMSRS